MKVEAHQIEEAAKELYIRALKLLPPDVKQGFDALAKSESDAGAKRMLGTMIANIRGRRFIWLTGTTTSSSPSSPRLTRSFGGKVGSCEGRRI